MAPMIKMQELYSLKNKKDNIKKQAFDRLIELCHRRIRNISQHGGQNTFYEIPGMLFGYPLYDINDCTTYVIDNLRKNGFLVQLLLPPHVCVIYISWDPTDLKMKPVQKTIEPPSRSTTNFPMRR